MLMAAAMAPTTLPHVIDGACGADPKCPEFIGHFADQVAILAGTSASPRPAATAARSADSRPFPRSAELRGADTAGKAAKECAAASGEPQG